MPEKKLANLPCPFCSGEGELLEANCGNLWFVKCKKCGVTFGGKNSGYAESKKAISAWNSRISPPKEEPEPILGRDKAMKEQADADQLAMNIADNFHTGCSCPNNGGGDCDWCNDYNVLRAAFVDMDVAARDIIESLVDNAMEKAFVRNEEKKLEG